MSFGALERPWRREFQGNTLCVIVRFRLTPKSSKNAIDGAEMTAAGPAFKAWVRAVPADGEANDALLRLVCDRLGVTMANVALVNGQKSRVKSVSIGGEVDVIETRLEAIWTLTAKATKANT